MTKEVAETRGKRVPVTTQRHTLWSRNVFEEWAKARNNEFRDFRQESEKFTCVPSIDDVTVEEVDYWFSKLALEVRKRDGLDYRHEVLYSLFCGLNRLIREKYPAISLFHSPELRGFQQTLDGRLKELQSKQQPFKKQADAISTGDENEMWKQGVLGTHTPDTVINTLVFLTAKLFVLRGGREQRDLSREQFDFVKQDDGLMKVIFKEKVSKTNQGGLKRRKMEAKVVEHIEDPLDERSFSFLCCFYMSKWLVYYNANLACLYYMKFII